MIEISEDEDIIYFLFFVLDVSQASFFSSPISFLFLNTGNRELLNTH